MTSNTHVDLISLTEQNGQNRIKSVSKPKLIRKLGSGKWLELDEIEYTDPVSNIARRWEVCRRKKNKVSHQKEPAKEVREIIDAVDIHATIIQQTQPIDPQIILVIQYRPAIGKYCVEFPSGLIDHPDETPEHAAIRELKEETGYTGTVKSVSPPICYEAGLTDSSTRMVCMEIDASLPENIIPKQQLEEDEWSVTVLKVSIKNLYSTLQELEKTLAIDSRLYAYALGIHMTQTLLLIKLTDGDCHLVSQHYFQHQVIPNFNLSIGDKPY
ncbi:3152_t:CDS:2 [Ambispora leptoticha]|uniref:3152_t:CDS:1 n=1 Tax=Ambispora leptoticha TaxID=144679 RepID=A0A9N9F4I3_9GLOM|nr:3152_t:CDS:2 [Ambispora leptoticha]